MLNHQENQAWDKNKFKNHILIRVKKPTPISMYLQEHSHNARLELRHAND